MTLDLESLARFSAGLADSARATILEAYAFGRGHEMKGDGSPVTDLDPKVERVMRRAIEATYPEHGILGEETGSDGLDREFVWVLDPIDGTKPFIVGLPDFGTLIALCYRGDPVIGVIDIPLLGRRVVGVQGRPTTFNGQAVACRDQSKLSEAILSTGGHEAYREDTLPGFDRIRRATAWNVYGGGCLAYQSLACGLLDLVVEGNLDPFDFLCLVPVVEGAGGLATDWQGRRLGLDSGPVILASGSPALHEVALGVLAG